MKRGIIMANYWGYRIDTNAREYFYQEILDNRLRQGWGYDKSQNLKGDNVDISARRNFPILNKVKKGDILLVPRIEGWDEVAIVEAVEDFNTGYDFNIDPKIGDYGHIFPVKFRKCFSRYNDNVGGNIRETLKCRSRFWNINRCKDEINKILETSDTELRNNTTFEERFRKRVEDTFDEDKIADELYMALDKDTQASEWEYILGEGFKRMLPDSYNIETTSNRLEKNHGADIIIRIPGIFNNTYVIAIQVKDYSDIVGNNPVDQICKANDYFSKEEDAILIDKYLIITKAEAELNKDLEKYAEERGVKIIFAKELKKLLSKMARAFIGDGVSDC